MAERKCCSNAKTGKKRKYTVPENGAMTLDQLPIGEQAAIVKILPDMRERKKFADVGLVPGSELLLESKAPFGGLLRVRVMGSSMTIHQDDATDILLE